ncbi:hypothetical protein AGMMS49982_10540 [Bacteroidia bacterium]|nr:hypothetical protein AGMMS49982_10540 [Bacteroidia bacterium]
MKHFIFLFFTVFSFSFTQGQTIVDVNADYFWLDKWQNINLVKVNNNSVMTIEIDYDDDTRTIVLDTIDIDGDEMSISEFQKEYVKVKETFLPVSKLYKNKTDKFISQLSDYQFNDMEDGSISKINITKNKNLLIREDYSESSDTIPFASQYIFRTFDTIPFAILRINKKHHIIAFDNNNRDVHFIMQTAKNNFVRIETDTDQYNLQITEKDPNDSIIKELVYFNNNKILNRWQEKEIIVHQIIEENGKYGMVNLLGEQVFPCIYDTIILPNKNELFLPLKNGKGNLYNRYFQQITTNVRHVIPILNYLSPYIVLQNNELCYLSDNFEICDTLKRVSYVVCGTVSEYNFRTEKTEEGFKIHKEIGGMAQIIPQVFPYFLNEKFDSLVFLNGQNHYDYDENSNIEFRNPNFLVLEKNKKFGIIEIEMPLLDCRKDSLQKYENLYSWDNFKEVKIVFEQQNITPKIIVPDLDSVVFSPRYNYPAKIYRNELCTYFPISKEPRYTEISNFNGYFARFRLPNRRWGWLSRDGEEFIDE